MSSSAPNIPSTAYKGQAVPGGLDPATVIRPANPPDSKESVVIEQRGNSSILGSLFPEVMGRERDSAAMDGLQLGDYLVQSRIGAGGMGAVFKAYDKSLDRTVALKVLSPSQTSDESSIKRFKNEAKAAARLDHDNVARIYGVGESQGLYYIAFEYVEGITVRELIRQKKMVEPQETINLILQIAFALKHTAAAGVVHRDVKPSNLIVTPAGRAKLVDWGLARKERIDEQSLDLTVSGTTLGTFDYISPEQARDPRSVDARSDIYSLGCTAYHMLTGTPPYADGTVLQKLLDHQGKPAPDPRTKNPRVPRELSRIVRKMMESFPDNRYSNPQSLIQDLLQLASEIGLGAVHPDGLTWQRSQDRTGKTLPQRMFWWWVGAFGAACAVALYLDSQNLSQQPSSQDLINNYQQSQASSINSSDSENSEQESSLDLEENELKNALANIDPDYLKPLSTTFGQSPIIGLDSTGDNELGFNVFLPAETSTDVAKAAIADSSVTSEKSDLSPTATTNENPTTAVAAAEIDFSPFKVLSGSGELVDKFESLEDAFAIVPDGGEIEISSPVDDYTFYKVRQLKITDRNVTLKAAPNSDVVLQFDTDLFTTELRSREFILINGGSLSLRNIHLQVSGTTLQSQPWSLFSIVGTGKLKCRQSTVTLAGENQTPAAVVDLTQSILQPINDMARDNMETEIPRRIQFEECVIRGIADLVRASVSSRSELSVRNSLVLLDGAMLRHDGYRSGQSNLETFGIEFSRVVGYLKDGLLRVDLNMTSPRDPMEMDLHVEECVLLGPVDVPLLQIHGGLDDQTIRSLMFWRGEQNLFGGWDQFVNYRGKMSIDNRLADIGFEELSERNTQISTTSLRRMQLSDPIANTAARFDLWTIPRFVSFLKNYTSDSSTIAADLNEAELDLAKLPQCPPLYGVDLLPDN